MRWERLFDELEGEAADLAREARDAELADAIRVERARVGWLERVRGRVVTLTVEGVGEVSGRVESDAPDWVLLGPTRPGAGGHEWLVATAAVMGARPGGAEPAGSAAVADAPVPQVWSRLRWSTAWRVLARDRSVVRAGRRDGSVVEGVTTWVGADHVEVCPIVEDRLQHRRAVLVPYAALGAVRCPR